MSTPQPFDAERPHGDDRPEYDQRSPFPPRSYEQPRYPEQSRPDQPPRYPEAPHPEAARYEDRPQYDDRSRYEERPRYADRPRYDDQPRPEDRPRYDERPPAQQYGYGDRPQYGDAQGHDQPPQYEQRARYEDRPQYEQRPRYDDRPRYDERPQYQGGPRYDDRPRYDEPPRYEEPPRYQEPPRYEERPRYADPAPPVEPPRPPEPAHYADSPQAESAPIDSAGSAPFESAPVESAPFGSESAQSDAPQFESSPADAPQFDSAHADSPEFESPHAEFPHADAQPTAQPSEPLDREPTSEPHRESPSEPHPEETAKAAEPAQPDPRPEPDAPRPQSVVDRPRRERPNDERPHGAAVELSLAPRVPIDETEESFDNAPGVVGPTGRPRRRVPEPELIQEHGPAKIMALCNQKGGVGKTTSTINLGAALAEYGRRVLLVDFDPQGALSVGLGVHPHQLDLTIYNVLMEHDPSETPVEDIVMRTGVDDVDLLPSNIDLSAAEIQLVSEVGREHALVRALRPVIDRYDYILVDCQPSLGLLTVNALAAADGVIIPLECEFFSLRGVALLIDTIEKVRERLNPKLEIVGILATMFDPRTLHSREVMARVVEAFGDIVFDTVINRTVRFPETTVAGEPITRWAPRSAGAKAYRELAREVIAR